MNPTGPLATRLIDEQLLLSRLEEILERRGTVWPNQPPPLPRTEQRGAQRVRLVTVVDFWSDTNFTSGFSSDVADGGLFITTPRVLPVGSRVRVSLTLPRLGVIDAEAEVRWVRSWDPREPTNFPGLGVRFIDLSEAAQGAIRTFCERRAPSHFPDRP